jgi:nucleoside-diphosphate-sugar epimerase
MSDPRFWNGRRVLVTGPNGFIPAHLIETLLGYGAQVVGFDLSPKGALDLHPGLR